MIIILSDTSHDFQILLVAVSRNIWAHASVHVRTLTRNVRACASCDSASILTHTSVCLFVCTRASASIRARDPTSIRSIPCICMLFSPKNILIEYDQPIKMQNSNAYDQASIPSNHNANKGGISCNCRIFLTNILGDLP